MAVRPKDFFYAGLTRVRAISSKNRMDFQCIYLLAGKKNLICNRVSYRSFLHLPGKLVYPVAKINGPLIFKVE